MNKDEKPAISVVDVYQADCPDSECCSQWWVETSDGIFHGFDTEREATKYAGYDEAGS